MKQFFKQHLRKTRRNLALLGAIGSCMLPLSVSAIDSNNIYSLGIEGFHDHYSEPDFAGVRTFTNYGSITGHYTHDFNRAFMALDARVSNGTDTYNSDSGNLHGVPQWEYEGRIRGGFTFHGAGGAFSPYLGAGVRYFDDQGKGYYTDLYALSYERRITQIYLPIGVTYSYMTTGGWTFAPNIEVDPLLWGNVNTRLTNDGGPNLNNTQTSGYGLRGEFMVGQDEGGFAWQLGPFFRYWNIQDSDVSCGVDFCGLEPHNTRLQTGAALRILW